MADATELLMSLDGFTKDFMELLYAPASGTPSAEQAGEIKELFAAADETTDLTAPIVSLFRALKKAREESDITPDGFGLDKKALIELCIKHAEIDEHSVTIGGRVNRAREIAAEAGKRVEDYLKRKDIEAPSGIQLWDRIQENQARIKSVLGMSEDDWNSYAGQLKFAIDDAETLGKCLDLPESCITDVKRITGTYRMRMTPYYASLIQPNRDNIANDPVLLQAVPTSEMVDTVGEEIPPVASDHSPVRLVDQFYPRVVALKSTNICAMYCTHCLRIAHIGGQDRLFSKKAYSEALDYIREHEEIRDVLITGGDAFCLSNESLRWLLREIDSIEHIRMKRLGTRIPVTTPQRIDAELLDILEESNDNAPVRVVTQINTAQEITPVSKQAFKNLSWRVSAILNQAVLLRGINDSKVKMWKLCETIQESYVRPYYIFNCSYRNPQYFHMRVPIEKGRDIVESMYGNISGDAIPRYIAAAGGKIPLHRSNVGERTENGSVILNKPWGGHTVYPDADPEGYGSDEGFAFNQYK